MRAQYSEVDRQALPQILHPLLDRTLVIVAHPDDETIACGGLMQFMREPCVVFATDGAPADEYWWKKHGTRADYASLRQREARSALRAVGVERVCFLGDCEREPHEFSDQRLYLVLDRAYDEILAFAGEFKPDALLTLAYEGGHPDHDSAAFLASRAGIALGCPVYEAPLYHRVEGQSHHQDWTCPAGESAELPVKDEVLARKKAMLAQYRSQFTTLSEGFRPEVERFRVQAHYDWSQPPHPGRLNYEAWGWSISASDVCEAFRQFDERHAKAA